MLEHCSCGHLPTEHVIAVGATGPGVYACEALGAARGVCGCRRYTPQVRGPVDLEADEELPWRAA
jgi:hypothetical protein